MDTPTEFHVDDEFQNDKTVIFMDEALFTSPEVREAMLTILFPDFRIEVNRGQTELPR